MASFRLLPDEPTTADLDDVVELLRAAFGTWPRYPIVVPAHEHLRWKLRGPLGRPALVVVTEVDARIVGVSIHLQRTYLVRGTPRAIVEPTDSVIHPESQGMGLYRARQPFDQEHIAPRFDAQLSFSEHNAVRSVSARHGEGPLPALFPRLLPVSHRATVARLRGTGRGALEAAGVAAGLATASRWTRTRHRAPWALEGTPPRIREASRFDARVNGLFERFAQHLDLVQLRDETSLNWRHAEPEGAPSTILFAENGDQLDGYATFSRFDGRTALTDLVARDRATAASLLEEVVQRAHGSAWVEAWSSRAHPLDPVLRARGFVAHRGRSPLLLDSARLPPSDAAALRSVDARVHVTLGDSDWV